MVRHVCKELEMDMTSCQWRNKKCAGAIGQRMPENWTGGFIRVDDSLLAFQQIANGFRQQFHGPVVGVTGSAGKTTTRAR